jgi:hypothetical protein
MSRCAFWATADRIIRSTRLPHERGYDAYLDRIAAEVAERRAFEMMQDAAAIRSSS